MPKKRSLSAVATVLLIMVTAALVTAADLSGTLKKIKDTGTISVGHREASTPFSYRSSDGKPVGYTMDLCYKIINKIKQDLNLPGLKVKLVPVTSQTRIPWLINGTIDMECGSTTNNLTWAAQIDYLHIIFITGTKLAVMKGSGIKEIEDLDGKRIALLSKTTNEKAIKWVAKEKGLNIEYEMVKDHPEGWRHLETGHVDAYASDHILLYGLISQSKNWEQYEVIGRFLSYDPYSIMIRRNDPDMRLLGNTVLSDLMRSGEIIEIYNKWLYPGPTKINMPISDLLKTAFEIQALPYVP